VWIYLFVIVWGGSIILDSGMYFVNILLDSGIYFVNILIMQ
jgi:hypothetical protein